MESLTENVNDFNVFDARYALPRIVTESQTKESILINATLLFAKTGYAAVSMRDLAATIGIKPASLYNHFGSKEILWKEVLEHAKELYLLYFKHLDEALEKAETFAEVLDVMFLEPERMANAFTSYAFSMIQVEQFRDRETGEIFNNVVLKYSIEFIQGWFEKCIAKGLAPAFDARAVATLFMHSILIGLDIQVQGYLGRETPYDPGQMFKDLHRFILNSVQTVK